MNSERQICGVKDWTASEFIMVHTIPLFENRTAKVSNIKVRGNALNLKLLQINWNKIRHGSIQSIKGLNVCFKSLNLFLDFFGVINIE